MKNAMITYLISISFAICLTACSVYNEIVTEESMAGNTKTPLSTIEPSVEKDVLDIEGAMTMDEAFRLFIETLSNVERIPFEENIIFTTNAEDGNILEKDNINMDFNGDGKNEILNLHFSNSFPEDENTPMNRPIRITMEINGSKSKFESEWNDGVYLYIVDLNSEDSYKDICVLSTGTGAGSYNTTVYRYDGKNIYEYMSFGHYVDKLYYNKKGRIYLVSHDYPEEEKPTAKVLDYLTKEIKVVK